MTVYRQTEVYIEYDIHRQLTFRDALDIYERVICTQPALTHRYSMIAVNARTGAQLISDQHAARRDYQFGLFKAGSTRDLWLEKDAPMHHSEFARYGDHRILERKERWKRFLAAQLDREKAGGIELHELQARRTARVKWLGSDLILNITKPQYVVSVHPPEEQYDERKQHSPGVLAQESQYRVQMWCPLRRAREVQRALTDVISPAAEPPAGAACARHSNL